MGGGLSKAVASHLSGDQLVNDATQQGTNPHLWFNSSSTGYEADDEREESVSDAHETNHTLQQESEESLVTVKNSPIP